MSSPPKTLFISILLFLLLIPTHLFGKERESSAVRPLVAEGAFVLAVEENLLSLKAREASLETVMEEIGRKMGIEVLGNIPDEETISIEFEGLPLAQALERLSSNYGYQMQSTQGGKKMAKIFVLPKGSGINLPQEFQKESKPTEDNVIGGFDFYAHSESRQREEPDKEKSSQPEPFKFEFDPSKFMKN